MPENAPEIVTLKIRAEDREWVREEQRRIRLTEHEEPTHAEVFARIRAAYEASFDHLKDSPAGRASAQLVSTDSREATVKKDGQRVITVVESKKSTASAVIEITPGEWTWVIRFLNILRSGTIAARAIKWNILTFSKVMGDRGDATDSPIPRPRLSAKDLERIRRQARTVEQALESEDEDGTKHQVAGARRGGTQG